MPELHLTDDERLDVELPTPVGAHFHLRPLDRTTPPPGARRDGVASVEFARTASPADVAILEQQVSTTIRTEHLVITSGRQLDQCPEHFAAFMRDACNDLLTAAARCIGLLRWRRDQCGQDQPLGERLIVWSFATGVGSGVWLPPPPDPQGGRPVRPLTHLGETAMKDVEAMIRAGHAEPVHRAILREAQNLASRNRRAAYVLAVTAAEVAVKYAIAECAPDAAWLAENAPTPPIVKMLRDYIPTLRAHDSVGGYVCAPSKGVIKALNDAVERRNKLVHKGADPPDRNEVEHMLNIVNDLVAVLEHSCGFPWAALHVHGDSRFAVLNLDGTPRTAPSAPSRGTPPPQPPRSA